MSKLPASILSIKNSVDEALKRHPNFLKLSALTLTGAIFGYSVSYGLGLNSFASWLIAIAVGLGVLLTRSLVAYLVIQTISLALVTGISFALFRSFPNVAIAIELVQFTYLAFVVFSPLIVTIPRVKKATNQLLMPIGLSFWTTVVFGALVFLLRERMPSDAMYALSKLYYYEDNAGITAGLANALKYGYSFGSANLGEFTTGLYIAASGLMDWFGTGESGGLLPVLTHWNMTLLFLAWLPLTALTAIALSGKITNSIKSFLIVLVMTGIFALISWPFIALGHTSVISSGLFAVALLSLGLNKKLALDHPVLYASLNMALGFTIGNIWFPLMPFAAAAVAITFLALLQAQYQKGNKRVVFILLAVFSLVALSLLPRVVYLVTSNTSLIQLTGATRSATQMLVIIWLALAAATIFSVSRKANRGTLLGTNLFASVLGVLLASTIYLVITGMLTNSGALGYGANKYLLTVISFSIPVFWMVLVLFNSKVNELKTIALGLVLAFATFTAQPDQQQLLNSGVISLGPAKVESSQGGVFLALQNALQSGPKHVLCVSDSPLDEDPDWDAYLCTRWGESLAGADTPFGWSWRTVMINQLPEETLSSVRETYADQDVVIIRFPNIEDGGIQDSDTSGAWWPKYTESSWTIVPIR